MQSGDARRISGLTEKQLRGWCDAGAITNPGNGSGSRRTFTVPELAGLAYAHVLSKIGYRRRACVQVVQFVAKFSESQLRAQVAAGNRFILPAQDKLRLIPMPTPELVGTVLDMKLVLERVLVAVERVKCVQQEQRKRQIENARRRGLASD